MKQIRDSLIKGIDICTGILTICYVLIQKLASILAYVEQCHEQLNRTPPLLDTQALQHRDHQVLLCNLLKHHFTTILGNVRTLFKDSKGRRDILETIVYKKYDEVAPTIDFAINNRKRLNTWADQLKPYMHILFFSVEGDDES